MGCAPLLATKNVPHRLVLHDLAPNFLKYVLKRQANAKTPHGSVLVFTNFFCHDHFDNSRFYGWFFSFGNQHRFLGGSEQIALTRPAFGFSSKKFSSRRKSSSDKSLLFDLKNTAS
jgi:hypothetical protein